MKQWRRWWRGLNPGTPTWKLLWWECVCRLISWVYLQLCYGHRWWGLDHVPKEGPVLLVCNHQSYLDLIVIGVGLRRHFHPMARSGLFKNPVFGWLIRSLNAFPIEQGKGDVKGLRHAVELLRQRHVVLVFPEGSRTADGVLQPFNPGLMLMIRRAKPTVVPMGVDGVFDIWPIGQSRPKLSGNTGAQYGEPIAAETLLAMAPAEAMHLLERRVESLRLEVRRKLRHRSRGAWPPPGPGDLPAVTP